MIITRKAIPRRTMLRGIGATLALPWLDAMAPALTALAKSPARPTPRLGVVQIEGESGLRIDYCETCRGYLKTYDGQGDEALLLADWTSLHLDVIAHDRGLKRLATSLFEIESALRA